MKIKALDSICLWSEDPDKLAKFYIDKLHLPVDKLMNLPDDRGVQFKIGGMWFFIGYHDKVTGKTKDPYRIMIGFTVDSVEKIYKELEPQGVKFIQTPSLSPDKTFHVATAQDPEENIIQFYSDEV